MTDLSTSNDDLAHPDSSGLPRWVPLAVGILGVVALLGFLSFTSDSDEGPDALDEFTFQTTDGGTTTLADFEGDPLVVNYFAAWCAPCRAELPDFETVSNETAGDIVFLGVSRDNVTETWRSLVADTGITYTTVFEGNVEGSFAFLEANAMPTTAFIGADGTVEHVWSGALTDKKLRELIAEHLT